jgi:hypothetical protein
VDLGVEHQPAKPSRGRHGHVEPSAQVERRGDDRWSRRSHATAHEVDRHDDAAYIRQVLAQTRPALTTGAYSSRACTCAPRTRRR